MIIMIMSMMVIVIIITMVFKMLLWRFQWPRLSLTVLLNLSAHRHTATLPQHLHDPLSIHSRVSPSSNLITLYILLPYPQFHQSSYRDGAQACSQSLILSGLLFSASAAAMHHSKSQTFSAAIISAILR